jgi:curved DNA-binding protein
VAVLKRDYYEVLGVSRDADDETIRRAFQAQAREWHPDVAEAPDAEARFRELAEAYTVLSRRESRLLYDRHGFRGRGGEIADEAILRGNDVHMEIELRSFEAEEGTRRVVSFRARSAGPEAAETDRRVRLRIPPGIEDGALLRVAGEGNEVGPDAVPGDLLVRVHVLPPPEDRRWVRYLAFALLLVAIAALVLYLVR